MINILTLKTMTEIHKYILARRRVIMQNLNLSSKISFDLFKIPKMGAKPKIDPIMTLYDL